MYSSFEPTFDVELQTILPGKTFSNKNPLKRLSTIIPQSGEGDILIELRLSNEDASKRLKSLGLEEIETNVFSASFKSGYSAQLRLYRSPEGKHYCHKSLVT